MKLVVFLIIAILFTGTLMLESCGPVVFTTRLGAPAPPWFYPNRIENVRYVYFPDHYFYYDFTIRKYIYLDSGSWLSVDILPSQYRGIDLRRSKKVRIKDFHGDNIKRYHNENIIKRRSPTSRRN